jgi:hypothetical protein
MDVIVKQINDYTEGRIVCLPLLVVIERRTRAELMERLLVWSLVGLRRSTGRREAEPQDAHTFSCTAFSAFSRLAHE